MGDASSRDKREQMRAERARREMLRRRRHRLFTILGAAVIVSLLATIAGVVAVAMKDAADLERAAKIVRTPAHTTGGAIVVGAKGAPVTVDLYYDYMCPACGSFERVNGEDLDALLEDGTARLRLHPMAFLDAQSDGTAYSTRTANAIATVADAAPQAVWGLHQAFYAHQPAEGGPGLTDAEIAALARDAGVPEKVVARFTAKRHYGWVAKVTQDAFDAGVASTPTVKVDGMPVTGGWDVSGALADAIRGAAEDRGPRS